VPGFFMWGENDMQVRVNFQKELLRKAENSHVLIKGISFPKRFHLLSREKDLDWFEPSFAPKIAELIHGFIERISM
jgi:hypothetical protein